MHEIKTNIGDTFNLMEFLIVVILSVKLQETPKLIVSNLKRNNLFCGHWQNLKYGKRSCLSNIGLLRKIYF